jgi:hypothetical protein
MFHDCLICSTQVETIDPDALVAAVKFTKSSIAAALRSEFEVRQRYLKRRKNEIFFRQGRAQPFQRNKTIAVFLRMAIKAS